MPFNDPKQNTLLAETLVAETPLAKIPPAKIEISARTGNQENQNIRSQETSS